MIIVGLPHLGGKINKSNLNSLKRDYSKSNIAVTSMPAYARVRPSIPCLEVKLERPEF